MIHKQWLFWNSHVHYNELDELTVAQHEEILQKVQDLMLMDPDDLLPKHTYLFEEGLYQLRGGSSGAKWILSMESALAAAPTMPYRGSDATATQIKYLLPPLILCPCE